MGKQSTNTTRGKHILTRISVKMLSVWLTLAFVLSTSALATDILHNSAQTGSTKWAPNGWGVTGGKYGQFSCETCHEPDSSQIKNVRSVISSMNGDLLPNSAKSVSVSFQNVTSMGNDRISRASSNRICEVCHSKVEFHNYNTVNNISLGHPTQGGVCTTCHAHNTGFKASCGGCHGNPPTTATLGAPDGLVGTPRASNVLQVGAAGAHKVHFDRGLVCDTCHYISNGGIKMPNLSNTIQIGFFGFGGTVTSGTYAPYSSSNRGYRFEASTANTTLASVVTNYTNANKCANVYCHGGGVKVGVTQFKAPLTGGTNTSPSWTGGPSQAVCGTCHGATADNPPTAGSHLKHAASSAGNYSIGCDKCHPVSGDNSHVQGNERWKLYTTSQLIGGLATYRGAANGTTGALAPSLPYGQCANLYCHSNGRGGVGNGNVPAPTWGVSTGFAGCTGCHGGAAGTSAPIASNAHKAHINNGAARYAGLQLSCNECHNSVVNATNTGIIALGLHVNKNKEVAWGTKASLGSGVLPYATNGCANVYCHTDGKGTFVAPIAWTSVTDGSQGLQGCNVCHGKDTAFNHFSSLAGEPNYANALAGAVRANSHKKHSKSGASSCVYCHSSTTDAAGALTAGNNHINATIDISPGGGKNFTPLANKTCSNISCHGVGSINAQWGDNLDCKGCHNSYAGSGATMATGKHREHIDTTYNPQLGKAFGCSDCHALTVSNDTTINAAGATNHYNGYYDYSGARAGKNSSYTTSNGVCNNAYCHSNGKGTVRNMAANNWKTGAALSCKGCHGSDVTLGNFSSAGGEPNYQNGTVGSPFANSHQKHSKAGVTSCIYCHNSTVTADGGINASGSHVNRVIEVAPGADKTFSILGKTCSNISCHGVGSVNATWGATLDCKGCHNSYAGSGATMVTGKHREHIDTSFNSQLGKAFGCVDCHALTVSTDTTISAGGANNHGNLYYDYSGARAGKNSSYSSSLGVCSNAYCHSDGKGRQNVPFTLGNGWKSSASLGCKGCHGNDKTFNNFSSLAGEPNYVNSGAGLLRANSHQSHSNTGITTCVNCHSDTVTSAGAITASGKHADGSVNVSLAGYNSLSKTCSNVSCHGVNSPPLQWGGSGSCIACHGDLLTKPGVHSIHINDLITSGLVTFYNYTANKSYGSIYRFGCANCHPTDPALHRNGTVEVTLNMSKLGGGSYLSSLNKLASDDTTGYTRSGAPKTSLTCELSYCHSNGKSTNLVLADYKASPNWYTVTPTPNKCGMCHDNPPQYADQSHYVASSSLGDNGTPPPYSESGHMVGIHFMNNYVGNNQNGFLGYSSSGDMAHGNKTYADSISCTICHSGIVSDTKIDTYAMSGTTSQFRCASCHTTATRTPLQPGEIADTSRHVNGMKDIAFPTDPGKRFFKTKAQLANVANALGWTRNGSYKVSGTYDSADLGVSSWSRDGNGKVTCLTACHVNQPNITWGSKLQCVSCHANQ